MLKVKGIDHLSISVSDFKKSEKFYDGLLKFLGFKVLDEYKDSKGWTNKKTRVWINEADKKGKKYYPHYYGVYFKDPDGLKFEGMYYEG